MKLTVMLPTFNRCNDLKKNILMLCRYIRDLNEKENICILISDNYSTDNTKEEIKCLIFQNKDIKIEYNLNKSNIGMGKNFIKIVGLAKSKYAMFLGDDDYISCEYLKTVMDIINDSSISCIIPSYYNIYPDGTRMNRGRDLNKNSRFYNKGFRNCFYNSWRAHQISGLVFCTNGLFHECIEKNICNSYIQIYLIARSCMLGKTYHLTEFPVKVTRPIQNKKSWNYGKDGLIGEVFENYKNLPNLSNLKRTVLEIKFLHAQYWRIAMYLKVSLLDFFGCIFKIQISKNTTLFTSIFLPIILLVIFIQKAFTLLLNGELINTLQTKVDIK